MKLKNLKVDRCMARLVNSQPFYASLALRLSRVEDKACKTAFWSDGVTLGVNPDLVDKMTDDQVMGSVCRLVEGLAHLHHLRRGGRDAKMWNKSSASVCTCLTKQCGFELAPEDEQYYSSEWEGKSAEAVYRIYEAMPKNDNGNGKDKGGGDKQKGDQGSSGGGGGDGQGDDTSDGQGNDPDASGSGSGSNGAGSSEIRDMQGTAEEVQEAEAEWKNATFQASRIAQAQGNCPAHAKRLCDELVESKIDWRSVLRKFVSKLVRNRYDWCKPNRRFAWQGMHLPSRRGREVGKIVLAVDTSSSIDDELLKKFAGEVGAILEDYPKAVITVLYCDAKVQGTETFTSQDVPFVLDAKGGGGTDFRPVFKWIEESDEQPVALIYLTDLEGTFPSEQPDYPVLWGRIKPDHIPPFGEVVDVE